MANGTQRRHLFSAEASFVSGVIDQSPAPPNVILDQGLVKLSQNGGGASFPTTPYKLPGVISIGGASTQVAGTSNGTWTTVASSVINHLDIAGGLVTADQIKATVTTIFPARGYTPQVRFDGTEFTNLKIDGQPVNPAVNLQICSPQPPNDGPYISDAGFLARAKREYDTIAGAAAAPQWLKDFFNWDPGKIQRLGRVDCSLVTNVPGVRAGQSFGHVVVLPGIANVYLAELGVSNHIELTMVRVELTRQGSTEMRTMSLDSQGHTEP